MKRRMRKIVSLIVAMSMMLSVAATAVEAAIATWLSPQPGQKLTTRNIEVAVGYNTHSDTKVTKLELWVDGKLHAKKVLVRPESRGVCSFWWDTAKYSDGPHDLVVKVYSGDELLSKVTSTGTVGDYAYDMVPPTVSFTNIKAGDILKGMATIKMDARDDSGEAPLVSLLVDKSLKLVKNRAPYDYDLDTTSYSDGKHDLETYAYDSAGNKSEPSVLQVAFKNGAEKPMVTEVTVAPHPNPASLDEGADEIILPASAPAAPVIKNTAGRAASSPSTKIIAVEPSTPVASSVAVPKPAPVRPTSVKPGITVTTRIKPSAAKPTSVAAKDDKAPVAKIAPAAPPVKVSIPAVTAKPAHVIKTNSAEVRTDNLKPVKGNASHAAQPQMLENLRVSPVKPVVTSSTPAERSHSVKATAASGVPVAPDTVGEPKSAQAKQIMAMVPAASMKSDDLHGTMSRQADVAPEMMSEPISSTGNTVVASLQASELRSDGLASIPAGDDISPVSPVSESPQSAMPKPVRMAAVPFVKDINARSASKETMACPPIAKKKDVYAKLEKRTLPASGKVKLRGLVEDLHGVLFWDAETHTVTAITGNMKMELQIGSKVAMVNGNKMQIGVAPKIVNGRTIIDAAVYHQACAFAVKNQMNKSAKLD